MIYVGILVVSLSLMGVPYLTGFYSKDVGLELVYGQYIQGKGSIHITFYYKSLLVYSKDYRGI